MKPLHKSLLPLFICPMITFAGTEKPIADVNWDISFEQVKQSHKIKPEEEIKNRLTYETELFDTAFHKEYIFNGQGKLDNILYYKSFSAQAKNCVSEYNRVKSKLESQYGQTKTDIKSINVLADTPTEKLCGFTATGEYKLDTKWVTNNANISFALDTWKGQPYVGVSFKRL